MVTRWLGRSFKLKDGDQVVVTEAKMGCMAHGRVMLTLASSYCPAEPLYLTTVELAMNLGEGTA